MKQSNTSEDLTKIFLPLCLSKTRIAGPLGEKLSILLIIFLSQKERRLNDRLKLMAVLKIRSSVTYF